MIRPDLLKKMSQLQAELETGETEVEQTPERSMAARFARLQEVNDYLAVELERPTILSEELQESSHRVWMAFKQALAD